MTKYQIGMRHSKESRMKMSLTHKGKTSNFKGKKLSGKSKDLIKKKKKKQWEEGFYDNRPNLSHKGEDNPSWKGGITKRCLNTKEYKAWRILVFERDDYTCQECGQIGGYLEAHHKKRWVDYFELRFDVDNGQTLCRNCHNETKKVIGKCIKKN